MTKDEAVEELDAYKNSIGAMFGLVALASIMFGKVGVEVEGALGIPSGTLAKALNDVRLSDAMSAYVAVLENAAKGQLAQVVDECFGDEVIIDG